MIRMLGTLALCAALGGGVSAAQAQTADRTYETGTVWEISYVETKPGMFDDYMAYLNTGWRQGLEARKKAGDVVSYKVLALGPVADGAPDVILMVEYKNMAVFDTPDAEIDKQVAAQWGSIQKANQATVSRQTLRTQRGGLLAREIKIGK